jgi:hypothetical protein
MSACAGRRIGRRPGEAPTARHERREQCGAVLRPDDAVGRHLLRLGEQRLRVEALHRVEVLADDVHAEPLDVPRRGEVPLLRAKQKDVADTGMLVAPTAQTRIPA